MCIGKWWQADPIVLFIKPFIVNRECYFRGPCLRRPPKLNIAINVISTTKYANLDRLGDIFAKRANQMETRSCGGKQSDWRITLLYSRL
jgi:hypothetical protein